MLISHHLRRDLLLIDGELMLKRTVGAWSAVLATAIVGEKGLARTGGHGGHGWAWILSE